MGIPSWPFHQRPSHLPLTIHHPPMTDHFSSDYEPFRVGLSDQSLPTSPIMASASTASNPHHQTRSFHVWPFHPDHPRRTTNDHHHPPGGPLHFRRQSTLVVLPPRDIYLLITSQHRSSALMGLANTWTTISATTCCLPRPTMALCLLGPCISASS
jgi:hypothetical protein